MKRLPLACLTFGFILAVGSALGQACISLTCAPDKTVECGTNWVFDPPAVTNLPGCSCGTNYTLSIVSTTTNASTSPCFAKAEQVWQAIDCSGALVTCTQTVTVVDTTPPVVTCAPDKTVQCGTNWVFDPPTAYDTCCTTNTNAVTIVIIQTVTNVNPNGCGLVASQIWDIRDCCGNVTNCNQHVTILPAPPVLSCTNYSIPCGGPFPAPPVPPPVSSPCCSAVSVNLIGSTTNFAGCAGSINLIWKAVDCCNNSTICTQVVSFVPSPPTLLCGPQVVQCGNPIPTNPPTVIDFCCSNLTAVPFGSPSTSTVAGVVCGIQILQAWAATNCCGGGSTICTQRTLVIDTTPPVLTCASNKTVQCGSGWVFDPPAAFDLCCTTNLTFVLQTNAVPSPIPCQTDWEGVWTVIDCCSNKSVCTQLVAEVDSLPPTVTCAPNKTVQCGSGWSFDPPTSAFDLCCGTNVFPMLASATIISSSPCLMVWAGVWNVYDCCTNYTSCTQQVTEVDTAGPVVTCTNKTVQCGTAWNFDQPSAFDLCCPNLTYQLISTNIVGTTNICNTLWAGAWQVTDCCSNSTVCTQFVSVVDTTPPTITCPSNFTVAQGTPWSFGQPTASDVCCGTNVSIVVGTTVTNGICVPYTVTRTWRAVDCCSNSSAPCSQIVSVMCGPAPPNDLCANAIQVFAGSPAYCPGTTVCATPSTGIATCGGSASAPDVWFRYVPICSGPVTIDTCGVCPGQSTFNTVLSAYKGPCNALSPVACNNNAGGTCGVQSRITFIGLAGTNYYLRVSGPICASGPFRLNITAPTNPPPNDLCVNATPVQTGSPAACGTTMCATPSTIGVGGIPTPCGSSSNSPDVWYVWTNTCSGPVTIDTCGLCPGQTTTFNTVLSVYWGQCGTLWPVACNDDACGLQSSVSFTPISGVAYYIRVAGFDTTNVGPFRLNINQTNTPPFNDLCANALTLFPSGVSMWNNCGANTDGPTQPGCQPNADVWFRYIPPCSGQVWVDTCGTPRDTVVSVYSGPCTSLSLLACNDNATGGPCAGSQQSYLTFNAVFGVTNLIRIGASPQGWGVVKVVGPFPAANTCPPTTGPFFCRTFQVLGTANNTPWSWAIRMPCCANVVVTNAPGVASGSSASVLAAAFCNSINAACGGGSIIAIPLTNWLSGWFAVCVRSCTNTPQPFIFSIGQAGTPATNQCIVANLTTPTGPPIPLATSGLCSFNPELIELPYANADLNGNGVDDALDIMLGTSADLNFNGIPDDAEACQVPQVVTEPLGSQVVTLGSDVVLEVTAVGTAPLSYQWSLNGVPLAGETMATLIRHQITADQLGDYRVSVANACGTNQVGPFTVAVETPEASVQPVIRSMSYHNGQFQLTFTTEEGQTYAVEYRNNLSATMWTQLTTVSGDGLDHTVFDNPPLPLTRFYRLRVVGP